MKILSLIIFAMLLLTLQPALCQSTTANKNTALRYIEEVVNQRKLEVLDEIFAPTHSRHELLDSTTKVITIADQKNSLSGLFLAFPDIYYEIGDVIAEDNKVVIRASFHGTHKGTILGIEPTGKHVNYISEIFFFRIENGKIIERWMQLDLYNILKKLKDEK
jgi:predicted ester cyclase